MKKKKKADAVNALINKLKLLCTHIHIHILITYTYLGNYKEIRCRWPCSSFSIQNILKRNPSPLPSLSCSIFFSLVPRKFKLGSEFLEKLGLRPKIERNEKIKHFERGGAVRSSTPPPFTYTRSNTFSYIHTHTYTYTYTKNMDTRVKRKRAQVGTIENYRRSVSFVDRLVSNRNLLFQWSLTPFKCM